MSLWKSPSRDATCPMNCLTHGSVNLTNLMWALIIYLKIDVVVHSSLFFFFNNTAICLYPITMTVFTKHTVPDCSRTHATLKPHFHWKVYIVLMRTKGAGGASPGPRPDALTSIKWRFRMRVFCQARFLNTLAWQRDAASFFSSRLRPGQLADAVAGSQEASRHVNHCKISAGKNIHTRSEYAVSHSTVDPIMIRARILLHAHTHTPTTH